MSNPSSSKNLSKATKPQMTEWEKAIGQNDWMNELKRRRSVEQKSAANSSGVVHNVKTSTGGTSIAIAAALVAGAGMIYFWPEILRGGRDLEVKIEDTAEQMVSSTKKQIAQQPRSSGRH